MPAGMLVAMSPPVCRALLPWEEPETGMGSPLATAIGVIMLAGVGGVWVLVGLGILVNSFGGASDNAARRPKAG